MSIKSTRPTMLTTGWFISIYLLLLQYTIPLTQAQQEGTSSISGYAFFDSSSDGIKDPTNTLDYGIYDISVWLFNCQDEILKTTKTNTAGYYSFENIDSMSLDTSPFGYYIYASVPKWYVVTETWNGAQDSSSGELLYPNVDSSVNPSTGRTNCFEVDDGETAEVDFGLNFYVEPTPPDTPQRPPAVEPTPATRPPLTSTTAPTTAKVTSNPTKQPIVVAPVPATRPPIQAVTAKPTNKPTIPSVVIPATPPPVQAQTLKPTTPSPTKETTKPTTSSPVNSSPSTTSKPTSSSPTKVPTIRVGTTITNSTLKQLSMTIAGISSIEDTNSWSEITKLHIECYYNGCNDDIHGVWDVTVDLEVVDVVSSTEKKTVRSLPWVDQQDEEFKENWLTKRRQLQETEYVQVIYNQVSTYTTSDPILYDDLYVATNPFTKETSQDEYIASLKAADSSVYDDVTSIISVRQLPSQGSSVPVLGGDVPPPTPPSNTDSVETDNNNNNNSNEGDGGSNTTAIIVAVVVCLVVVIVASAVIVKYRRMGQQNAYSGEPVGNGPKSSMRQFHSGDGNGDLEHGNGGGDSGTYSNGFGSSSSMSRRSSSSKFSGMTTFDESAFEHLTSSQGNGSSHSEKMIQIIAPPGKLGVVVDTPPSGGCAYVCEIKNTCPIRNEIQLEDRIIAVDRDDVQKMSAVDVSKLLAKRSRNEERKITVLRRAKGPSDSASSSQPKGGSGSMFGSVADSLTSSAEAPQASPISSSSKDKEVLMDVTAPAGKLGVVLVTPEPPETGPAYVFKIRDDSPLVNKLLLGDKVLAVDDEDVRGMTAINVSKLLGSKSGQESRKISIKRVVDISAGGGVEVTPNDTTPAPTTSSGGFDINTPGEIFEIIAPPGKLGIVVDSPPEGGCAFVSDIKQECPIKTRIKMGDKLIKVDDEDVSTLKAVHVSSKCFSL